jgi:hypothetical protein
MAAALADGTTAAATATAAAAGLDGGWTERVASGEHQLPDPNDSRAVALASGCTRHRWAVVYPQRKKGFDRTRANSHAFSHSAYGVVEHTKLFVNGRDHGALRCELLTPAAMS